MKIVSTIIISFLFCIAITHANPIEDYGDPLYSDGLSCWAQSNGRIINTTPCSAGSPSGKSSYTISTTEGNIALAFTHDVTVEALAIKERTVLTKIQGGILQYENKQIILSGDTNPTKIASVQVKNPTKQCIEGKGNSQKDLSVVYKNGTKYDTTICYDSTDGNLQYNETTPQYTSVPSYTTEEYYESISPVINNNYERMPVYDLKTHKAKITIDWHDMPAFGEKKTDKFWVIAYTNDLDTEINDRTATVLDPSFNSSWAYRMTINLTCPASAVGDQRCFFNDSVMATFDHRNLVTASLSQVTGFDVRVLFRNDSIIDLDQNEIPLFNLTGWNQTNTTIMFKLQGGTLRTDVVLTAGVQNTSYYLYFENDDATSQGYTISEVFDRGGMDHNQTNLLMAFDFDNETGEVIPTGAVTYNRVKSDPNQTASPYNRLTLNASGAIDVAPGRDSIGPYSGLSGLAALGRSVGFDPNRVSCLIAPSENRTSANWTQVVWFMRNGTVGTTSGAIIDQVTNRQLMSIVAADNRFRCIGGSDELLLRAPALNTWVMGVCERFANGTIHQRYYEGTTVYINQTAGTAGNITEDLDGFAIGNRPPCANGNHAFAGFIDSVMIYNTSLQMTELDQLYNQTRPRQGGPIVQTMGVQESTVVNTAPTIVLNTSVWPNGTSIHLNETVDVRINVTFLDADGDNGTINGTFFVNNTNTLFVAIGVPVRANQTIQFNLSNTTFGRNATIYFNGTGSDNATTQLAATMVTSSNVTVTNIPPPQISNLTPTASQRVRQNFTINWNQTGDEDDPMSNLGWNTTVNGTAYCGRKNATTSCLVLTRPAGQNTFNITTLDGENYTSNALVEVIIDETIPSIDDVTNHSIFVTNVTLNWTTNEPTNYSLNYSQDCTNLNSFVRGVSFNQSVSVALTGLASGKFYCYQVTVYDNVTSEFGSNYNSSVIRNFTLNSLPTIVLNTSIWPNGTNTHLNETVDVSINATYLDADGDNGTINATFIINGSTQVFVNIGVPVRANQTIQFNLSNTTFGKNATIYVNVTGSHNLSNNAINTSTSANVTVRNIPPPAPSNITPANAVRVRQNFTINFNQSGDSDDPLTNLRFNTTVNGTAFCGINNATTSCLVLNRVAGQNAYNISVNDGENYTYAVSNEVIVDEVAPSFVNLSNVSIQNTLFIVNWTIDEPSNFTINYSDDCANLNQRVSGTTFNTSGSVPVSGLIDGTQYCWRITFNDNTTSEFGANINTSITYNLTTSGSPPSGQPSLGGGGGGGGGPFIPLLAEPTLNQPINMTAIITGQGPLSAGSGSGKGLTIVQVQGSNKATCNIEFAPKTIEVEDGKKFASILVTNNEETSYSPDIGIVNVTGLTSALPRLVISNPLGEVLPHRQGQVGLIIDQGVEGGDPIRAQNQLLLIDDRCQSVLVTIETDVTGKIPLSSYASPLFSTIIKYLSSIPKKIVDLTSFFGSELGKPITESVTWLRVYMLFILILVLTTGVLFSLDISKMVLVDTGLKLAGIVFGAPLVTAIIVSTLRNTLG